MCKYEKIDDLDRYLCKKYFIKIYDSLFDPTKLKKQMLSQKSISLRLSPKFYAGSLSELECFVDELLSNDETPFVVNLSKGDKKKFTPTPLARQYFKWMSHYIEAVNMLSPRYEYSERINVFITCCNAMGLLSGSERLDWINIKAASKTYPRFGGISAAEIFNMLVKAIRREWKTKKIQAKVNARKREASDRHIDYCNYADALFDDEIYNGCARQVLLRIDLGYKKHGNIRELQEDLTHLFDNVRCNSLLHFINGYIVKIEYGVEKGIHGHVLLFLDGSRRMNSSHTYLTKQIGKYWVTTITEGRGNYWNANKDADHYDKLGILGIGVINWYDIELRRNLKELVIGYLCKTDQFIRPKWGPKVRLFRRGLYPEIRTNKVGRPRKALESYAERQFPLKFMSINPCDLEPKVL